MLAVVLLVVLIVVASSRAATDREQAAYRDYAASVDASCADIGGYQMALDVDPTLTRAPVDAGWARIAALPAPSALASDVAEARTRLGETVGSADVTSPAGADRVANACAALVTASRSHGGPAPATMLPGPT